MKKIFYSIFISMILLTEILLIINIKLFEIPKLSTLLLEKKNNIKKLEKNKNTLIEKLGLNKIIKEYNHKNNLLSIVINNRINMYSNTDQNSEFYPNFNEIIFPIIKKHLYKGVEIGGISISSKGEIIMPIYSQSYTIIAKQYWALKTKFRGEKDTFLKDLKINSFSKEKIELIINENNNSIKKEMYLAKALIIGKFNKDFFYSGNNLKISNTEISNFKINKKPTQINTIDIIKNILIKLFDKYLLKLKGGIN